MKYGLQGQYFLTLMQSSLHWKSGSFLQVWRHG